MQKTTKLYSGSQNTGSPYDPTRSGSPGPSLPLPPCLIPRVPPTGSCPSSGAAVPTIHCVLLSLVSVSRSLHGRLLQRMQQLGALLNPNYSFRNLGHAAFLLHKTRGAPSDTLPCDT